MSTPPPGQSSVLPPAVEKWIVESGFEHIDFDPRLVVGACLDSGVVVPASEVKERVEDENYGALRAARRSLDAMNERRAEAERRFNRLDAAVTRYHEDPDALLKIQQKVYSLSSVVEEE